MTEDLPRDRTPKNRSNARNKTLRILAIPIFILLLIDSLLGNSLMYSPEGQPFPLSILTIHIGVALLLVGVTGLAFVISLRLPGWRLRVAAGLSSVSTMVATLAGTVFLLGGESPTALAWMEAFAAIAFIGDILLFVWGSLASSALPQADSLPPSGKGGPTRLVETETAVPMSGTAIRVVVEGRPVAVYNVSGLLYGLDAECGHGKGPLDEGTVRDGCVTCPKHKAQYDLRSGEVVGGNFLIRRISKPVRVYRIQVKNGHLVVEA